MKRVYQILFVVFIFLFLPLTSSALDCPYNVQAKLKKISANILYDYNYIEQNGTVKFHLRFINLDPSVLIYEPAKNKTYNYNDTRELILYDYEPGKSYRFEIKSTNDFGALEMTGVPNTSFSSNCASQILYTFYITTPSYNPFYTDNVCQGVSEYKLCQKWYKHNLNVEKFRTEVNVYKEQIKKNKDEAKKEESVTIFEYLGLIYLNYYYIILAIIIVLCGAGIYKQKKKEKFRGW